MVSPRYNIYLTLLVYLGGLVPAGAQTVELMETRDIRTGMKGVGKTVFSGDTVEEFGVEILGVLENAGPKQSIILARLSGGPLERTGVMQGMSGSPVYIGGKLIGAVALAFPFAKEPIAGIRPIREMIDHGVPVNAKARWEPGSLMAGLPKREAAAFDSKLIEIATPVSFSGFTRSTLEHFAPQLRALGLQPQQSVSGGTASKSTSSRPLEPGSMISVQLVSGDLNIGADGTVTHIDGNKVYAFGHRFLSVGATELPFARSSVMALLPNLSSSFKISSSGEWLGAITADHSAAVSGEVGRRPRLVPLDIQVKGATGTTQYRMQMVQDQFLSPFLLQMALYSSLDATERTLGVGSVSLKGRIDFDGVAEPMLLDHMYAGDFNAPLQASLGVAMPVAYALQNNLDTLRLKSVDLVLETHLEKKQLQIDNVWTNRRTVRPGEPFEITALLLGENGQEVTKTFTYQVPVGAPAGVLYITVADAPNTNSAENRFFGLGEPKPASEVIAFLNSMRGNTQGYVRIWRTDPSFQIQGETLPDPPPSLGLVLARSAAVQPSVVPRTSTVTEIPFSAGNSIISGVKTVQVEVKE